MGDRTLLIRAASASFGLCLALTLACSPSAPLPITKSAQENPPTLADALAAWDKGCEAIRSYDVYIRSEQKAFLDAKDLTPGKRFIQLSHQIFDSGKRRIESGVEKSGQAADHTFVWDGMLAKQYDAQAKQLSVDLTASYTTGGPDYESWFKTPGSMTYADILRERPDTRLEQATDDQYVLYTPPVTGRYEYAPFGFRIWLDASKNSLPSRIDYLLLDTGKEELNNRVDISLDEVAPNTWAPVKLVITHKSAEIVVVLNRDLSKFNIKIPETVFDLEIPSGTRVVDRTGERRAALLFANSADVLSRIKTAITDARLGKAHVLLMLGARDDRASHQLARLHHGILDNDPEFRARIRDYRAIGINAKDPDTAQALADLDIQVEVQGTPTLVVLDGDGKLLGAQSFAPAEPSRKLDRRGIEEFLAEHEPNKMDAEQLLATALEQANRENKRVYLQETGMACAPCLAMSRFLDFHKTIIDQDYVVLKISRGRYTGGDQLMKKIRKQASTSIPWVGILDHEGHVLANSENSKHENMGFPSDAAEIEPFLKMLSSTAQRMTPEQLQELRKALAARTKTAPLLKEPATARSE